MSEQAVGRILRTDGPKLVIDIIDQHAIFKRHWTQRRRWYNRQKFHILHTNVEGYKKNQWAALPKRGYTPMETTVKLLQGKCLIKD